MCSDKQCADLKSRRRAVHEELFVKCAMPEKLECEKLMTLETPFHLLNTNKQQALKAEAWTEGPLYVRHP